MPLSDAERQKRWRERHPEKNREASKQRRWSYRERNPDQDVRDSARRIIALTTGLRSCEVPEELVEAKMAQLKARRAVEAAKRS